MSGSNITLQFVMVGGSTTSGCVAYPPPATTCQHGNSLDIQSMGKTGSSDIYRTIQATYDLGTSKISTYYEIPDAVP